MIDYLNYIRMASNAASEKIERICLNNDQGYIGFIKIDGRSKFCKFVKNNSIKIEKNIYSISYITLIVENKGHLLKLEYDYCNYGNKETVKKCLEASVSVLKQLKCNPKIILRRI